MMGHIARNGHNAGSTTRRCGVFVPWLPDTANALPRNRRAERISPLVRDCYNPETQPRRRGAIFSLNQ
jgi:hypothetical protein